MRSGETSVSEPLMKRRNRMDDVRTGGGVDPGISSGGALETGPSGIRLVGGVNPDQALVWNVRTCRHDAKVEIQVGSPGKDQAPDAWHRGGAARTSDEGSVMELERRGSGIRPWQVANR